MSSLKKNFSWVFLSNLISALSKWGGVVLLAKITGTESIGLYSYGLAIVVPIFMLTNFSLRNIQVSDATNEYTFTDYFSLRIVLSLLGLIISLVICFGLGKTEYFAIVFLLSVQKIIESIIDIFNGYEQKKQAFHLIAKCLIYRSIIGCLILGTILFLTQNLLLALSFQILSDILVFSYTELKNYFSQNAINTLIPKITLNSLSLFKLAIPMGGVSVLGSLNANIPRYFIENTLGVFELGVYSGIIYFTVAGNILIGAIGQASIPRFAVLFYEGKNIEFNKMLHRLLFVTIGVGGVGVGFVFLFGKYVLTYMYSIDFLAYEKMFLAVMISGVFLYIASFLGFLQTVIKKLYYQYLLLYFLVSMVNVVCCHFFIGYWGLYGAVWSLTLTFALLSFVSYFMVIMHIRKIEIERVCSEKKQLLR